MFLYYHKLPILIPNQTAITEKLTTADSVKQTFGPARQELKEQMDAVNAKKNQLNEERNKIFENIKELQAGIKKKVRFVVVRTRQFAYSCTQILIQITAGSNQVLKGQGRLQECF